MTSPLPSSHEDSTTLVDVRGLELRYCSGQGHEIRALSGIDLAIPRGQLVCVIGKSGSGKSSLLHVLAGLRTPSAGSVRIQELEVGRLSAKASARLRRRSVGVIFQFFNLLPMLTVAENVAFPLRLERVYGRELVERVHRLLREVGLEHRRDHYPDELSGGEMQRVAIARALVIEPALILADEPTGNLDTTTGERIWRLLRQVNRSHGVTMIVVTHDEASAAYADRVVVLEDGRLIADHHAAQLALRSAS